MIDGDELDTPDDYNDEPDFIALYEPYVNGAKILPPVARTYAHDRAWRQRFVASFTRLAERLESADDDKDVLARCTAEEVALHLAINLAKAHLVDGAFSPAAVCHLPNHGRADEDFNWTREMLFEDRDVLMLYKPALDGIEVDLDGSSSLHRGSGSHR